MKNRSLPFVVGIMLLISSGCVALVVGGAAGALGAYAVSRDTIQGETDIAYDKLWNATREVSGIKGVIREEDASRGYIAVDINASYAQIRLIRLTRSTTRLKISCRRHHLPNLGTAEELFIKIMEKAR